MNIKEQTIEALNQMRQLNREMVINFIKKNIGYIIIFAIIIAYLSLFIEYTSFIRVPRYLRGLNNLIKYVDIEPIKDCLDYIKDYKLADFYIASSARSYLSGDQINDYATQRATQKILRAGARFLEFEIFNKNFNDDTIPVVSTGKEVGNILKTLNLLPFEKCCEIIERVAFSERYVKNYSDPLFISLKLRTNRNIDTINKIADMIKSYMGGKLLDSKYSYSKVNIAQEPLKNFIGKVVILSDSAVKGSKLEELTNHMWNTVFLRESHYEEIKETTNHRYLIDWNRRNITKVHPNRNSKESFNYNPNIPWRFGCQFVSMNYQHVDDYMKDYILKFDKRSFVLKPKDLRASAHYYSRPKKQDPNLSLETKHINKDGFNIKL